MTAVRDVEVRGLYEQDLEALLRLYRQLHPQDSEAEHALLTRTWREILASPWLIYIGVFSSAGLVSTCHAAVVPNLTRGARPYGVIENVVTDASQRRRGFARIAMYALLDRCWEAGCYKVMLSSGTKRAEMHTFYESLGFDRHAKQAFVIASPDR